MTDFENQGEQTQSPDNRNSESLVQRIAKIVGYKSQSDIKDPSSPQLEIIDESTEGNILSDPKRVKLQSSTFSAISPYSTEGFAENIPQQKALADFLIKQFDCKNRGGLLDVGFGTNIHIADRFAESGIKSFAIDNQQCDYENGETLWTDPKLKSQSSYGVNIYSGDVASLRGANSEIKEERFGLILFNGSWASGGNNWTVAGEVMEAKHYNQGGDRESIYKFMDDEKNRILETCKKSLALKGMIGVVSSRYAFHGAGYTFEQYPEEKMSFIDLYSRFMDLGAKKISVVGLSQNGIDKVVSLASSNEEIENIRKQLKDCKSLPAKDIYAENDRSGLQRSFLQKALNKVSKISELDKIARIDAIFAEF